MSIDQKRYRSFAKETLLDEANGNHNREPVYLFLFGLPLIGAGILPMDENWFRFLVLVISVSIAILTFGMTKAVINIAGSFEQSILPRQHRGLWREALASRIVSLVLPYLVLAVLVGFARYGLVPDSIKAVGFVLASAAAGAALATTKWSANVVWYDYFCAGLLLILMPFAWISWSNNYFSHISMAFALLPISAVLLALLYWRIDAIALKQNESIEFFRNSRDLLRNLCRFQSLADPQSPYFLMLFLTGPLLIYLTAFYLPYHFDSRFWLKVFQAPIVIGSLIVILTIRRLHWRYFLIPKSKAQSRVGTDVFLTTIIVFFASSILWSVLTLLVYWAVKLSFNISLPVEKIWFPKQVAICLVEIFVWLALSVWVGAYLIKPSTFLAKILSWSPNNFFPMMMVITSISSFGNQKLSWPERIRINAEAILAPGGAPTYFASCAVLIVVFIHLANRAWAKRDLTAIWESSALKKQT